MAEPRRCPFNQQHRHLVEEDGRHYVRHYLQDFGSNLGSGSTSAQQPRGGYEYLVEPGKIGKGLIGLGF